MNVREMIEILSEMDPDAEVRLATQPNWPLQSTVAGIASSETVYSNQACSEHGHFDCEECVNEALELSGDNFVWIAEGSQCSHPYAPRGVWDAAREN